MKNLFLVLILLIPVILLSQDFNNRQIEVISGLSSEIIKDSVKGKYNSTTYYFYNCEKRNYELILSILNDAYDINGINTDYNYRTYNNNTTVFNGKYITAQLMNYDAEIFFLILTFWE